MSAKFKRKFVNLMNLIKYNLLHKPLELYYMRKVIINGNLFYYDKRKTILTDDIINKLTFEKSLDEPQFIDIINGEIVLS